MALTAEDNRRPVNSAVVLQDSPNGGTVASGRRPLPGSVRRDTLPTLAIAVMAAIGVAAAIAHIRHTEADLGGCVPQFGIERAAGVWESVNPDGAPNWVLSPTGARDIGRAQLPDTGTVRYEASLMSPTFVVPARGADLEFHQRRAYSWANTVGVLEVAIDGGPFLDIAAAGGTFSAGAYDGRSLAGNPLGFRSAWAAAPDLYTLTRVSLPSAANGKSARLRFRIGSAGTGDALPGWSLDNIHCAFGN
jgi:hypothetical protein